MPERAMYPVEASFMNSSQDILPSFDGNGRPQNKGRWLALSPSAKHVGVGLSGIMTYRFR